MKNLVGAIHLLLELIHVTTCQETNPRRQLHLRLEFAHGAERVTHVSRKQAIASRREPFCHI